MADNGREVALVTGTSRGIGRFLASHFLERGNVVVGCRRSGGGLDLPNYRHFTLDVTEEGPVRQLIQTIRKEFGRLDVLVNNAGVAAMNPMLLMPTETARRLLEINVLGPFILCREAARLMQRNRFGRIVNIGSVAVPMKIEGEAIYASSKSALESFSQVVARELAPFQITCNVIALSPIQTHLIEGVPQEKIDRIVDRLAIKRPGRFEDVANVVDFFVSRASDYITGQTIYLGGV